MPISPGRQCHGREPPRLTDRLPGPKSQEIQVNKISASLCFVALAMAPIASATAQQIVKAGSLVLAGYQATCGPVQTVIIPFNDIAAARSGRIYLNPKVMTLPRAQQMFWYTHECAHFIFGGGEARADCWSVQQGRIQGWLTAAEFSNLARSMRAHPGDATHVGGHRRVAAMQRCYEGTRRPG